MLLSVTVPRSLISLLRLRLILFTKMLFISILFIWFPAALTTALPDALPAALLAALPRAVPDALLRAVPDAPPVASSKGNALCTINNLFAISIFLLQRFLSFALRPLFSGRPASIFFPMALSGNSFFPMDHRYAAAIIFATASPASIFFPMALPASSFFPIALRYAAASIFVTALPLCRRSASAPRPATNLIRRRKVLRFG